MKNNNLKTYAKYFSQFIIAIAGILLIIDFTIHRHAYFHLEEIIGFHVPINQIRMYQQALIQINKLELVVLILSHK